MATTNTIQGTINWAAAFILNRPATGVAGAFQEPGLTLANLIMSTILSPPFAWQWNRATTTFSVTQGTSDYPVVMNDFGYLEKATITYGTVPNVYTNPVYELENSTIMAAEGVQNRPFKICPLLDDNAGNITWRLFPIPDQSYTATLTYQKAPIQATSLYGTQLAITSVAAASGGVAVYTGTITGGTGNALAGKYFQAAGFTASNGADNGLYLCTASSSTTITLQNPNAVIDTTGTVAPATTWAPIPDKYNFLYERGMLAHLHGMYDSATYLQELQLFFRQLVGCSEGWSETAKAIFLEDRLSQLRTTAMAQAASTAAPKKAV
jgi:hypothetical protein